MKLNEIKVMSSEFGVRSINTKRYKLKINYELFSPHSAFRNPQSGMTLIEVILVMVIVGILAATILPRFNFAITSRASVDGAAYMIASDIRYAQEFAMANRVSKSVVFISGTSVYTFNPTSSFDSTGQLPSGVTVGGNFTITFNSLGEPILGGGGSVTVSGGGQTKTITVVNYTGKVNIS
jgi:MSHA pilin protein MshA